MERIIYRITLDTHKSGVQRMLQGFNTSDNLARKIAINLVSGGDTYNIPLDHVVAMMYVTTPRATEPSINECIIEDNTIIYEVLPIEEEGITEMQLKLISTDLKGAKNVLISPKFTVEVINDGMTDDGAETSPTFTALESAIAKAQEVYDKRVVRIEITEECIFRVYYADGAIYENYYFHESLYNGNAMIAESFAVGGTGIREGEDTDNAKYYAGVSQSASVGLNGLVDTARALVDEAKLHSNYTVFGVDFESGNLNYLTAKHDFDINKDTGELEVKGGSEYNPDAYIEELVEKKTATIEELQQMVASMTEEISLLKARVEVLETATN